jgi:hypothetical protein
MRKNWNGLIKVLEIWKTDAQGNTVWKDTNLYNTLHLSGEEFILAAVFSGGVENAFIPENYYFGLDNRSEIDASDTMETITDEPTANGYERVSVASSDVFTISLSGDHYRATGPIISFSASGGSWGPVGNLFMTTTDDGSGALIASVPLSQAVTVDAGETINLRMGLSLKDCP